jgi:5-methylcytosine-specific restriction endonuclease McrA
MTPARRARILARFDGHCAYPECAETAGLEIDHEIALELGGKDNDANCRPYCGPHHKRKTALDMKLIAKMRRRQKKNAGAWPASKSRLRGGGFRKGRNREELDRVRAER